MIDKPQIVLVPAQATAAIRLTIPREECQQVFGPAVAEIMSVLEAQGVKPAGPVFSYHLQMPSEIFDFEVGVPVDAPIEESGRVRRSELPAATVARTVYQGPYEGLPHAWGQFMQRIAACGRVSASVLWESYVEGPHSTPDAGKWTTELNRPLVTNSRVGISQ